NLDRLHQRGGGAELQAVVETQDVVAGRPLAMAQTDQPVAVAHLLQLLLAAAKVLAVVEGDGIAEAVAPFAELPGPDHATNGMLQAAVGRGAEAEDLALPGFHLEPFGPA